jgi:Ice-binding-like/IPTL-CTERM motif
MMKSIPLATMGLAALLLWAQSTPALATAVAPPLGTAGSYAVLATNVSPTVGEVTCTRSIATPIIINGNVGTTFTSITNTGCTITGSIDAPVAAGVVTDFNTAYSALNTLNSACDGTIPTTSTTISPGVYCSAAGTTIGAGVIFTLDGNASDVWVFKVGTTGGSLTGNSFQVVMGGSALACNVYWWTQGAATMTDSNFIGTILAGSAITLTRGNYLGRALATTDFTDTNVAPLTFAGCAPVASITVNKNFIPISSATVPVALTCTSGTATNTPQNASMATPAVFTVGGASPGATCTATETVPTGYTANQTNCLNVALDGSCTIVNTLASANLTTITVNKNFIPDNPAPVPVALVCTSGTVAVMPINASEGAPAVFQVTGASAGATCTATETTVPTGYTPNQTNCVNVVLNGSCTIINTLAGAITITVNKVFSPHNPAPVPVALTCTSGTVTSTPLNASEGGPAVFTVTGVSPTSGATCTATETVPLGYTPNQANCVNVALNGSCTITNTLIPALAAGIPTLSRWAMIMLAALVALAGFAAIRRFIV